MLFVEHPISGGLGASLCDAAFTASVSRAGGKSGEFQTRDKSFRALARSRAWERTKSLGHFIALLRREQGNFCIILIIEAREHKASYF